MIKMSIDWNEDRQQLYANKIILMLHENNGWAAQQGYIMVNIDTTAMDWTDNLNNLANKTNLTNMTDLIHMTYKEYDEYVGPMIYKGSGLQP